MTNAVTSRYIATVAGGTFLESCANYEYLCSAMDTQDVANIANNLRAGYMLALQQWPSGFTNDRIDAMREKLRALHLASSVYTVIASKFRWNDIAKLREQYAYQANELASQVQNVFQQLEDIGAIPDAKSESQDVLLTMLDMRCDRLATALDDFDNDAIAENFTIVTALYQKLSSVSAEM